MNIRKEQVLCIATVALAAWLYNSMDAAGAVRRRNPKARDVQALAAREPILVDPAAAPKNLREIFVEPSESRPLEPRQDLDLLPIPALPVAILPLPVGQQAGALHGLRRRIEMAQAKAERGNGADPKEEPEPQKAGGGDDPSLRYDSVLYVNQREPYWGLFLGDESEKFKWHSDAARRRADASFQFQWINQKTGERMKVLTVKGDELRELRLAKTLRNEIGLAAHKLVPATHNVNEQRDFVLHLIEQARKESWVFELAMQRAQIYRKFATSKQEGLLYVAKVLHAQGDLPAAYRLFRDIDADLKGSSFQLRGLGYVEMQLGLDRLAEQHLREAVDAKPIDPRGYAVLAQFLLERGRAREAVPFADLAVQYDTRQEPTADEKLGFAGVKIRAHLAVGDVKGAEAVKEQLGALKEPRARYLAASVDYAKGEFDAALDGFQVCVQSGLVPDAQLGVAACKFAKQDFDGALADFGKVVEDNPRLRHLALAGRGLVLSHVTGEGANALEQMEAALVANPVHAYSLYLQGRQRRLNGDLQGAVASLKQALRLRDDFTEALAELTQTYFTMYENDPREVASLLSAIRYIDRTVELDQKHGGQDPLFLDMQGEIHRRARDLRGARKAFAAGEAAGSKNSMIGLALLDYEQKRSDRCEERFSKMERDEPADSPIRAHIEGLLEKMRAHANKEQILDDFAYTQKTKNWEVGRNGDAQPRFRDGTVRFEGKPRNAGRAVYVRRTLTGAGRFVELSAEMKLDGTRGNTTFAGVQVGVPGRGANPTTFEIRFGVDERGKLLLERIDGRKKIEPKRFDDIDVAPGQWHSLRLVTFVDPKNPKGHGLFLRAYYDGREVAEERLQTLRRNSSTGTEFHTDLRVEGRVGLDVDVSFRRYRRVQIKGN